MSGATVVRIAAGTEAGRRGRNEDAFLADPPVFLVSDGMGGHVHGRAASEAVVDAFRPLIGDSQVNADAVSAALARAGASVDRISARAGALAGATATGLALIEDGDSAYWLVFNIGDSRTYRYAGGCLTQLTVDHSVVQELIEDGAISEDAARDHPDGNVITRSISPGGGRADFWMLPVTAGERLLLCSDGVTKELTDSTLAALLDSGASPEAMVDAVLGQVVEAGARDNATVVVIDVERGGSGGFDDTMPRAWVELEEAHRTAPHPLSEESSS